MAFVKEERAQVSVELLLVVAGVIVVATLVGLYLKRFITKPQKKAADILENIKKG